MSAALFTRSAINSSPILLTISLFSRLNCVRGGNLELQTVVKVHKTIPRKNTPNALTNVVITLKINTKTILDVGRIFLTLLINEVGAAGEFLSVGIRNPSRACPE